jgi:hypothetical protein
MLINNTLLAIDPSSCLVCRHWHVGSHFFKHHRNVGGEHAAITMQKGKPGRAGLAVRGPPAQLQMCFREVRHCTTYAAMPVGEQTTVGIEGQFTIAPEIPLGSKPSRLPAWRQANFF